MVEAELLGNGNGEGSTWETCRELILSVDRGGRVTGGNGKIARDCFKVGDDKVVTGICVAWLLKVGNEGEGGMVREWAGR